MRQQEAFDEKSAEECKEMNLDFDEMVEYVRREGAAAGGKEGIEEENRKV